MQKGSAYERTVLTILGLIVLAFAGLLLRALFAPGYTVREAVEIPASCQQVWPWLSESERRPIWMAGLVDVAPLTAGPAGAGQRNLLLFRRNGERMELGEDVTAYEPGETWQAEWDGEQEATLQSIWLAQAGEGGCAVRYELSVMPRGIEARVMAPFSHYARSADTEEGLARLAELAQR